MSTSNFEPESSGESKSTIDTPPHPVTSSCSSISQIELLQYDAFLKLYKVLSSESVIRFGMKLAVIILQVVATLIETVEG